MRSVIKDILRHIPRRARSLDQFRRETKERQYETVRVFLLPADTTSGWMRALGNYGTIEYVAFKPGERDIVFIEPLYKRRERLTHDISDVRDEVLSRGMDVVRQKVAVLQLLLPDVPIIVIDPDGRTDDSRV